MSLSISPHLAMKVQCVVFIEKAGGAGGEVAGVKGGVGKVEVSLCLPSKRQVVGPV